MSTDQPKRASWTSGGKEILIQYNSVRVGIIKALELGFGGLSGFYRRRMYFEVFSVHDLLFIGIAPSFCL